MKVTNYHIIGDIHGQAGKLEQLLQRLGYELEDGIYQQPHAKVVFLGDFIDRGRQQRRVIDIVRPMIDQGHALAVMGNHEFNAICYHTLHPETADPLRPHSEHNTEQHEAFLNEYALHDEETRDLISWFKSLPVFLEVKNPDDGKVLFRAIHACWNQAIVKHIPQYLKEDYILKATTEGSQAYKDIEVLLKGPEIRLPDGMSFRDKNDDKRRNIRIKWWSSSNNSTYREVAMVPEGEEKNIPTDPIPTTKNDYVYPDDAPPVFFGHYWLTGEPLVIRHNLACLDYSAGNDGPLVAYHWKGEEAGEALKNSAFIYNKIQDTFCDVPRDEDTAVLFSQKSMLDQYEVLYQAWSWSGINAESIIFLSEDISELNNEELKVLVKSAPLVKQESELTVNERSGKYTFVNFNFIDSEDESWEDNRTDEEKKRDKEIGIRNIGRRNAEVVAKCKKLRNIIS